MDYKFVRKLMIDKEVTFKDLINKIPTERGGVYGTRAGLIKAMKYSKKNSENCKKVADFLLHFK